MENSQHKGRDYRPLAVVPLAIMAVAIVVTQVYVQPGAYHPPPGGALQLLGSGTGSAEFGTPLSVLNEGNKNITILNVAYDGKILKQGTLGGTVPQFAPPGQNSSMCYAPSDAIIFPTPATWNMDTGGLCTPTIMAGQDATLYIGEYSPVVKQHIVVLTTSLGDFIYTINPPTNSTTTTSYADTG